MTRTSAKPSHPEGSGAAPVRMHSEKLISSGANWSRLGKVRCSGPAVDRHPLRQAFGVLVRRVHDQLTLGAHHPVGGHVGTVEAAGKAGQALPAGEPQDGAGHLFALLEASAPHCWR